MNFKGYKVMQLKDGEIVSGADSRQSFKLEKNTEIKMPGNGLYIGMDKDYVMDYYSGLADTEVLLTIEFKSEDIVTGNMDDVEPELSLRKAKIVDINKIQDGEIIENKIKKVKQKIKP